MVPGRQSHNWLLAIVDLLDKMEEIGFKDSRGQGFK